MEVNTLGVEALGLGANQEPRKTLVKRSEPFPHGEE